MARGSGLRKTLAAKFDDELKFFKGWIDKPRAVGSIVPTSSVTARRMASVPLIVPAWYRSSRCWSNCCIPAWRLARKLVRSW